MERRPVLVTLTSPTAAGKSHLLNYIRDVAKLPCFVSTTTRPPRAGEVEGVDYFFITEEESKRLEAEGQFAELAIYRGVRYGVTKDEFFGKLEKGVAFLIVEPSGIDHYAKPAVDAGALHLKFYVHTDPAVRLKRFMDRAMADFEAAITEDINAAGAGVHKFGGPSDASKKLFKSYMDRMRAVSTVEMQWGSAVKWDGILFGEDHPQKNLDVILRTIEKRFAS